MASTKCGNNSKDKKIKYKTVHRTDRNGSNVRRGNERVWGKVSRHSLCLTCCSVKKAVPVVRRCQYCLQLHLQRGGGGD